MFRSAGDFPFTGLLEERWREILEEYEAVAERLHAWPEKQYYDGEWRTFGLYAFGHKQRANCAACPRTTQIVEQIPGLVMAGFSRMAPGTHIMPHRGYEGWAQYVLRCHLGLVVNRNCALRVGNETRGWQRGKTLVFCDATEHEAWNHGSEDRVVLLLDFRNPEFRWRVLNPDLTPEIEQYIREQWHEMSLRERMHYWAWRLVNARRRREHPTRRARS